MAWRHQARRKIRKCVFDVCPPELPHPAPHVGHREHHSSDHEQAGDDLGIA